MEAFANVSGGSKPPPYGWALVPAKQGIGPAAKLTLVDDCNFFINKFLRRSDCAVQPDDASLKYSPTIQPLWKPLLMFAEGVNPSVRLGS